MRTTVKPGDVFAAKLADGRYKVVRVLRRVGTSSLVCTSDYLGVERPALDDPRLQKTVVQNRFFHKRKLARCWLAGNPPPVFELLGNIPPTNDDAAIECDTYAGKWDDSSGNEAFLEWRWLHDRAAFEEEVRNKQEERERLRRLPQKPKKMVSEEEFWSIIERFDWRQAGNDRGVLARAIEALAAKTKTEICCFQERLAYLLYQLDTKAHAGSIGENSYNPESDYLSADGFLYARCVVVANGKEFYDAVLADPTKMPKDMEFESLLGLASTAYELKTGEDFEYSTGCSYESFSNPAGWKTD